MFPLVLFFVFATHSALVYGTCTECTISTSVYDDLKCIPKYSDSNKCCPVEYDCSSVYNRPKGSCHLRGKYYTPGNSPLQEDVASYCDRAMCTCGKNDAFDCIVASDSCAEFWVPNFIRPGCYLAYEQNRCCHSEQVCPPFNENQTKCKVGDVTYREGERFEHPTKKCTKCVCDKGFDGKLEAPTCLPLNCTAELRFSKQINEHCAPYYLNEDDCCPRNWVCRKLLRLFLFEYVYFFFLLKRPMMEFTLSLQHHHRQKIQSAHSERGQCL
ncbi:hypothetical protein FQA39_LY04714 [Lamprigera yunnana]|nr:hypothetical protein FQA39_LY04714 [Lamprigera yunnana]